MLIQECVCPSRHALLGLNILEAQFLPVVFAMRILPTLTDFGFSGIERFAFVKPKVLFSEGADL